MGKVAIINVREGKILDALNRFWRGLLETRAVDALLIPQTLPGGRNVVQTLVSDPQNLKRPDPLAPVLPVNSARLLSQMTRVAPSPRKVGAVLRSCELRALVELVKLKQASLDNLVLIGVDCLGTCSVGRYAERIEAGLTTEDFVRSFGEGQEDVSLREACQICEFPAPVHADLTVCLIGADLEKGIPVVAQTPEGAQILEGLDLKPGEDREVAGREEALSQLIARRTAVRDETLAQMQREAHGMENLLATFAGCINCRNCSTVCPMCYCKTCFFDSPVFDVEADRYLGWTEKRGTLRMPADMLLFHLTRMTHMAMSCVGCGMCQEACPNDIPVAHIFRMVGMGLQTVFDYVPGRSLEEELPLATFREGELPGIAEE